MGRLELQNITINYGATTIVDNLSIFIDNGEIVSLLGPSGAGKTTILKTIAGLIKPVSGSILIDDVPVNHLPAEKRDTVLVFQKPLLFPFLNVAQNIGFGLKMQKINKKAAEEKINKILEITELAGLSQRKVHQLSGGQQQRVALARGLVLEPSILLLDEPLSNLDAELRQQMRELIQTVQKQTGTTMLFVTHDQSEALAVSDRICLLLGGTLRQTGVPEELFYSPADPEVARFFGCDNIFNTNSSIYQYGNSDTPQQLFTIRPEDIDIISSSKTVADSSLHPSFTGEIIKVTFEGRLTRLTVKTEEVHVTVLCKRPTFQVGQTIQLHIPEDRVHYFPMTS